MSNHSVYISYSRHDSTFATDLYDYLKKVPDVNVVMDNYQLNLEKLLTQQKEHMDQSEKVVILLSPEALNEKKIWILLDNIGFSKAKISAKYICCIIKPCRIPNLLQSFDCVDFSQMNVNPYEQLFRLLNVPHETNISDHAFTNEIKALYQDYFPKEGNDQIDFIVDHQRLGLSHQALVKCVSVEIDRMIAYEIIAHFVGLKQVYPGFKNIVISKNELKNDIKMLLCQNEIDSMSYGEIVEEIVPLQKTMKLYLDRYDQWKIDHWQGKNAYIHSEIQLEDQSRHSAVDFIDKWSRAEDENILILLGDLGTGKTTTGRYLCQQWAKKYLEDSYQHPAPLYIELDKSMKDKSFEQIIDTYFFHTGFQSGNIFRFWMKGKIIIVIDAFDVIVEGSDWDKVEEKFNAFQPRNNQAKLILICRTHYFKSIDEQNNNISEPVTETRLYKQTKRKTSRFVYIREFSKEQIIKYLGYFRSTPENDFEKIQSILDLNRADNSISYRPLTLDMIVRSFPQLDQNIPLSLIDIYDTYTRIWIERKEIENVRHIMNEQVKYEMMLQMAWFMWKRSANAISLEELNKLIHIHDSDKAKYVFNHSMTASYLERNDQNEFSFKHKSFQEFFLARKLMDSFIKRNVDPSILNTSRYQKEVIFFLNQMDKKSICTEPLCNVLKQNYQENISENALQILYWKARCDCNMYDKIDPSRIDQLKDRTKDLFSDKIQLQGAMLKSIELKGAYLKEAELTNANLTNASLEYAFLDNSKLDDTNMTNANLTHASLKSANLRNANIKKAVFAYANVTDIDHTGIQNSKDAALDYIKGIDKNEIGQNKISKPVVQNLGHCNRAVSTHKHIEKKLSASGGADGLVLIYDSSEYRILWALEGHTGVVNMVRFSHHGNFLASSSSDRTIRLWDVHTGNMIHIFKDYVTPVSCIAFSKNDQFLASTSDNQIVIWKLKNKEKIVQQMVEPMITELLFPDHDTLYAKDIDDVTWQWKISDSKLIHLDAPDPIEFPQGNDDWLKAQTGHQSGILALEISSDGNRLASANMNGTIRIWDLKNGCLKFWLKGHDGIVSGLSFIDNSTLISCGNDETIRKWNLESGECIQQWKAHNNYINYICSFNSLIASASNDKTVALWKDDETPIAIFDEHVDWVQTICFSNDGTWLASGGRDNKVIIWDLLTRKSIHVLTGHKDEITALQFTDNQEYIISASMDRTIRIWHIRSKKCDILNGHEAGIKTLKLLSNKILASGGRDNTIRIWNIEEKNCNAVFQGNMGQVNAICFSPNQRVLISAGDAGRIQLWDYKRKKCLIWMYAFSKDDWMLLTPDGDYDANGKELSYLGYTEQDTLTYTKASNMKESFKPEKIEKIFQQYF
jgi:WD40 repeat protein